TTMAFNQKTEDAVHSANRAARTGAAGFNSLVRHQRSLKAIIDAALTIEGDLHTDREVEVHGKVTGDLSCTRLLVGKDATITGNVKADEVVVRGKVKGTIRASRLILQDTAHVEGDIFHDRIIIDDGARFIGTSNPEPAS